MTPLKLVSLERPRLRPWPNRSPEGQALHHAVFLLLPGREAKTPDQFGFVGGVIGQNTFAIESSRPPLENAATNVPMQGETRTAERSSRGWVQQRCQRPFHKIKIGSAGHLFLRERLFELANLHLLGG